MLFKCTLMFVVMSMCCLFKEGLREDLLYQLSHPPKIKSLLIYLLLTVTCTVVLNMPKNFVMFPYHLIFAISSWLGDHHILQFYYGLLIHHIVFKGTDQ